MIESVDLYCHSSGFSEPVLYRSGQYPICERDIDELEQRGHTALYVAAADFELVEKELFEALEDLVSDDRIAPVDRFSLLQLAVSMEVDLAFRLIKTNRIVSLSKRVADSIATLLEGNQVLPRELFEVVQHDFYTFTHVTNVAGFATLLAEKLGITDGEEQRLIAEGALLHDIGKRFIPTEVLCKPTSLNDKERELMESHTTRGFIDLRTNADLDSRQLLMVYQHHERVDGAGYPVRLVEDEIHPWSKLLAVVDVFDAVTSKRPYRTPMPLPRAIEYLEFQAGTHFNEEIVRCWTSAVRQG